jgi:CBS domain-containing protein
MQLKAKDIAREPIKLEADKTLYDARNILIKYNISRVVIANKDNSKAIGIITEKDIARFLCQDISNRRLNEIRVDELMSKNLITVTEDQDVSFCAKLMLQNSISSVIVFGNDKNGISSLSSIFTKSDLTEV